MTAYRRLLLNAVSLSTLLFLVLTGCNLGTEPQPSVAPSAAAPSAPAPSAAMASLAPTATIEPTPSVPQGGALTIRVAADIPDLKPWDLRSRGEEYVADLMYNGLTRLGPQLDPQPDLAAEWAIAPGGQTITFTLASGVTWHDGQPLTGEDVAWTLQTLREITPTNALLSDLRATIAEVRAPADDTVVVGLTRPYAPLLAELAVPILPRHLLSDQTPAAIAELNFWDTPVGTGPFKFDARQPNQSVAFVRNDAYFRGQPNLEQAVLVVAPDAGVAAGALREQQLLLAEFPKASEPITDTGAQLERGAYPENGWYGVAFNTRPDRLFADARLRQALALSVDVNAVVASATAGAGQPIASTLLRSSGFYPDGLDIAPADPDAARQLLEDAGWTPGPDGVRQKEGRALSARLWVRGDDPRRTAAAQQIADAAAQVGIQLEVVPADFNSVILAKLAPPYDWDLLLGSWVNAPNSAAFPTNHFYDPDDYALLHSSQAWTGEGDTRGGLRNITGFSNADYDKAADAARAGYDPAARRKAIADAQAVLGRERPYLLLWTDAVDVVLNARLQIEDSAIQLDTPRLLWNVERWYLEPE